MTKITTDAQPLLSPTELEIARIIQLGFNKWPRTSAVEMAKAIAARLASTSPAPDGADLSLIEEAIGFAPYDIRDAARLAFYRIKAAAPQPVVEKDNG